MRPRPFDKLRVRPSERPALHFDGTAIASVFEAFVGKYKKRMINDAKLRRVVQFEIYGDNWLGNPYSYNILQQLYKEVFYGDFRVLVEPGFAKKCRSLLTGVKKLIQPK